MIPLCFYCGVDSRPMVVFFALVVGSGVLSALCFMGWALVNRHLDDEARLSRAALDAEEGELSLTFDDEGHDMSSTKFLRPRAAEGVNRT